MTQPAFLISILIFAATLRVQQRNDAVRDYSCKTEIDSLTKQVVYTTADTEPINEGGKGKLTSEFMSKIITNSISIDTNSNDPNIVVAFIVDNDGNIKGERVINDKTQKVGKQMLNIIKSFKWTPAKCNGKYVPMIQRQNIVIDFAEQ